MLYCVDLVLPLTQYLFFKTTAKTLLFSSIIFDFIFRKIFPENFESQALENAHFLGF
jgi:hypothetical protein